MVWETSTTAVSWLESGGRFLLSWVSPSVMSWGRDYDNMATMDNFKRIYVFKGKYGRCGRESGDQNNKILLMVWRNVETQVPSSSVGRSFKNILLGEKKGVGPALQNDGPEMKDQAVVGVAKCYIDNGMMEKLWRSLVGESAIPLSSEIIPSFFNDWHTLVEVKPLGSFKMVLTFDAVDNMREALVSPFLLNIFGEVRAWFEVEANRSRIAWIEMYGMSLQAWNMDNFNRIVEIWGTVLHMEEDSVMGDCYNSIKAIVDTTRFLLINDIVLLDLNGKNYEVFVREISVTIDSINRDFPALVVKARPSRDMRLV
ncbi:hypothetical protein PIB30_035187 [Stylosanthes scabra]|uniref:DUF4283 domain-containing protein n=1 Tax=Stylosanthes scabra TaxID=79078 RepID=A0ABU6Z9X8_9FABA|nr:hypothetical protein [Stylosanthes scabra]